MNKSEAKKRIIQLKEIIEKARRDYYLHDRPTISDAVFDTLQRELVDLETQFPEYLTLDSPSGRVGGAPLKKFKKVTHKDFEGNDSRMNSLNDAFSEKEVIEWLERLRNFLGRDIREKFYCDLKMDGLAVELVYDRGVFVRGSTRGDGMIGEDVTQNLKTIHAIPLSLKNNPPDHFVVRGEVFLLKKDFLSINKHFVQSGEKPYANPRNLAAGSVRQLDQKITARRALNFYAYGIPGSGKKYLSLFPSRSEEYRMLMHYGIPVNPLGKCVSTFEEIFTFHKEIIKKREKLLYEIDGIVVTVDDNRLFDEAGVIGKAPRASLAYKFAAKEASTRVLDIVVQVGRTGVLTPVAKLEPVTVSGVRISSATLHNDDEIKRLGLKIGDTVVVSRAGDVIPKVIEVLKNLRTGKEHQFVMPRRCPADGSEVIRDGALYRCANPECGARQRELLYHFVSRGAFNMLGLGFKIIDRFIDEGLVSDAADLFTLEEGDINTLERFGELSARNIISEIQTKKEITLPRFLYSLGILHVGEETANVLSQEILRSHAHKNTIFTPLELFTLFQGITLENLQNISDVGPKVAESIFIWFHSKRNNVLIKKLSEVGVRIYIPPQSTHAQILKGKTFVLTGTLSSLSREEAKQKIKERGGVATETVSRATSYVVYGENPGSKFEKAKKLDVPLLNEHQFIALLQ